MQHLKFQVLNKKMRGLVNMVSELMLEYGNNSCLIREISEICNQRAKEIGRENLCDFSIGNPSVPSPAIVRKTMLDILQNEDPLSVHSYTSAAGLMETRDAIAANLNKRYGTDYTGKNIYMTSGASTSLICSIKAILKDENSEIIGIAPYFMEYKAFTEGNGGKFRLVSADTENFQINFDELESLINENTQGVIINSPNNPSGVIYSAETLTELANLLKAKSEKFGHIIYLISDEPYRELVYSDEPAPFTAKFYNNTIVCYSYSKSFSLPGERIGYVLVPPQADNWVDVYSAVAGGGRASGFICAPSLMQKVIARCCDVMPDIEAYRKNRDLLYNSLTEIGYECANPSGAFYLFVKAPTEDATPFCMKAMEDNLFIVPGSEFACPSHFRAAYCVDYEMIERSIPLFKKAYEEATK